MVKFSIAVKYTNVIQNRTKCLKSTFLMLHWSTSLNTVKFQFLKMSSKMETSSSLSAPLKNLLNPEAETLSQFQTVGYWFH